MTVKCLIIAAGRGSRLSQNGSCKPLIPLLGVPLIERAIRLALEAGVNEFFVVAGYKSQNVRAYLDDLSKRLRISITVIINEEWEKENGLSVLKAQEYLQEPFLLLMADHLFDPSIARDLLKVSLHKHEIALAVDRNIRNSVINMEDVTRVKIEDNKICNIGKNLEDYSGFDTGIFFCTPAIFSALEQCVKSNGDTTLSKALLKIASKGHLKGVEINGRFWIDVDDPPSFSQAENKLVANVKRKSNDGPIARYLNRPLSIKISKRLVSFRISPNQISLFSFLCSILAAGFFTFNSYSTLLFGGLLAQFASIIDGCDGEVARLKFQSSTYGGWLDAVLDRYAEAFMLFGLTWHVYVEKMEGLVLFTGFLAIIGTFMLSYTADKYDGIMQHRIHAGKGFRIGRDMRIFLIFLGAIFNQTYLTLAIIAAIMNLETMRRIKICKSNVTCPPPKIKFDPVVESGIL